MPRVSLLGVPIDPVTPAEALEALHSMLAEDGQHHVMTPNSEMLVAAARDKRVHALLQQTSLNLPDSAGLLAMARRTKQRLPARVTGVDTVLALSRRLNEAVPVFLLGSAPGVAQKAARNLERFNPALRVAGTHAGSPADTEAATIIERVNQSGARLLLVAYGAPQQDLWIAKHLPALPSVRVAMGVGGTLDFLAGEIPRAPQWLQRRSLEWLWRLFQEPRRAGRIWNAVVVFPWLVMRHGRGNPHSLAQKPETRNQKPE